MENYMDTTLSAKERAQALLAQMSLEEKMAQVCGIFSVRGREKEMKTFLSNGIGQISTLGFRMCDSMEEAAEWQRSLQTIVMENSPHHIPAVFHMEGLCGAFIQDMTAFPSGINRGAAFDPELEEKAGEIVSRQEASFGITQILAPVLDISRDSRFGRQSEPYGEDPTLAAVLGTAFTKGIQGTETAGRRPDAAAKHFLGFHSGEGGIHGASTEVGERLLREVYGKPFQAAIHDAGLKGVMPCYCSIGGLPIHANRRYLTGLLRDEMGFDGVVVSDYGAVDNVFSVQHAAQSKADAGLRSMKAGMDVELPMPSCYSRDLAALFASGEADISILDTAVLRILEAKFRMGLFEHPFALEGEELRESANHAEDDAVSAKIAEESIVLLKNDGILPLKKDVKTIAVIGPHAANARFYFGGYTHLSMVEAQHAALNSMAGVGAGGSTAGLQMERVPGSNVQADETEEFDGVLKKLEPDCKNLLEALREALPEAEIVFARGYEKAGDSTEHFDEALSLIRCADVVLLTLGGKNGSGSIATMGEGIDATDINLPPCQDLFLREAAKLNKPLVGIHFDGRPCSSDTADAVLNALLECFTPATFTAEAVTKILLGLVNPSGHMPVTTARCAGQIPIYYNHPWGSSWSQGPSIGFADYVDMPHRPRYPFGHGLSYTSFSYADLSVGSDAVRPFEDFEVSCTVENTGSVPGTELVQLYLSDRQASMTRPIRELQGFVRLPLQPGEKKRVVFTVSPSLMAFLDEDMRWKVEKGEFSIEIGASSEDIRLTGAYTVTEDGWLEGRDRAFAAKVRIEA